MVVYFVRLFTKLMRFFACLLILYSKVVFAGEPAAFILKTNEVTQLSGLWQFYPGYLLTGFDLTQDESSVGQQAMAVLVPSDWKKYRLADGRYFGSHGAGTYTTWLENLEVGELYAIRLEHAGSSHRIFIGDAAEALCAAGKPALSAAEYEPDYRHVLCRFKATAPRLRLTIQVANFLHHNGGLREAPYVGKDRYISGNYLLHTTMMVVMLAFLLAVVVIMVVELWLNRTKLTPLYLIGLALAMSIHCLNGSVRLGRELFDTYNFFIQARLNMFMLPFGVAMLLLYLASWQQPGRFRQFHYYLAGLLLAWSLFFLLAPFAFAVRFHTFNLMLIATIAIVLMVMILITLQQQGKKAILLGIGIFFLVLGALGAILRIWFQWYLPNVEFIGFLLFLVSQTSQSAIKNVKTIQTKQVLFKEQKQALKKLTLLVPLVHLQKVTHRWRKSLMPGIFYHTEACIMFLRIEPQKSYEMTTQELMELHAAFAEEVTNYTEKFGGLVEKISVGRYILSFNNDPAVAITLAVEMRYKVREWSSLIGSYILYRCGIHYGKTVWGLYGSPERWAGGYIGDTINTAARLENLCARYHTAILISQDVYFQSVRLDDYLIRMLEPVKLKGKNEHIFVYEVLSGLPEEQLQRMKETLPFFGRGLQNFLNKNFSQAIEYFTKVVQSNPQDFSANLYLQRAKKLMIQENDEEWNPVEILTKK